MNQIILKCRDCLKAMKDYPDNYFQIAIVDPPFGLMADTKANGSVKKSKRSIGGGKLQSRSLNSMETSWDIQVPPPEYFKELFRVSENQVIFGMNYFDLPPTRGVICWDKKQPWENFSGFELAWTSYDHPAWMIRISNTGGDNAEPKIHPTQKPVELFLKILRRYCTQKRLHTRYTFRKWIQYGSC